METNATGADIEVKKPGFAVFGGRVDLRGQDRRLEVDLVPQVGVAGVVRGPDGSPVEGVRIKARKLVDAPHGAGAALEAKTDAHGRYSLDGCAGGAYYELNAYPTE